jgi:hypothetical protein
LLPSKQSNLTRSRLRFLVLGPWGRVQAREWNGRFTSSWGDVPSPDAGRIVGSNLPHAGFWGPCQTSEQPNRQHGFRRVLQVGEDVYCSQELASMATTNQIRQNLLPKFSSSTADLIGQSKNVGQTLGDKLVCIGNLQHYPSYSVLPPRRIRKLLKGRTNAAVSKPVSTTCRHAKRLRGQGVERNGSHNNLLSFDRQPLRSHEGRQKIATWPSGQKVSRVAWRRRRRRVGSGRRPVAGPGAGGSPGCPRRWR